MNEFVFALNVFDDRFKSACAIYGAKGDIAAGTLGQGNALAVFEMLPVKIPLEGDVLSLLREDGKITVSASLDADISRQAGSFEGQSALGK